MSALAASQLPAAYLAYYSTILYEIIVYSMTILMMNEDTLKVTPKRVSYHYLASYAPSGAAGRGLHWAALCTRWLAVRSGPQPGPTPTASSALNHSTRRCWAWPDREVVRPRPLPQARQALSRLAG